MHGFGGEGWGSNTPLDSNIYHNSIKNFFRSLAQKKFMLYCKDNAKRVPI